MTRLIFPHQLFRKKYDEKVILIEHPRFFTDFDFHKQKPLLHRTSMKEFESEKTTKNYIEFEDDLKKPFRDNEKLKLYRLKDHTSTFLHEIIHNNGLYPIQSII